MVSESARRFEVRDDGEVVGRPGLHDPCVDRPERAIEQNVIELLGELHDALPLIAPGRLAGMVEGQGVLESDASEVTDGRPVRSFVEVAGDEGGHRGRALTHEEADLEIMIRTASQVGLNGIAVLARGHAQVRVQDLERAVRRIDQVMPSWVPPVRSRRPSPRTSLTTTSTQLKSADGVYQERSQQREKYGLSFLYDSIGNITKKTQTNDMQVPNGTGGWNEFYNIRGQSYTATYTYGSSRPHAATEVDELFVGDATTNTRAVRFDADGNQSGWLYQGITDRAVTWNEEDRITRVTLNGVEMARALYDGSGQREVSVQVRSEEHT